MSYRLLRISEWAVNLLSLALLVFISVVLVRQHAGNPPKRPAALQPGQVVPIRGMDWSKKQHTLVLALQTGCHYCADSAPFYQELLNQKDVGGWQAVAVLPQTVEQSVAYMQSKGYSVSQVRQMDLGSIGVSGTPTLLLVNQNGKLEKVWVGKLAPSGEDEVAAALGIGKLSQREPEEIVAGMGSIGGAALGGSKGSTSAVQESAGTKTIRMEPPDPRDPVRIVQILDGGQDVTPLGRPYLPQQGRPFQARNEWLKDAVVVLENFSNKEIEAGSLRVDFPQTGTGQLGSAVIATPIMLGRTPDAALYTPNGKKRSPESAEPLRLMPNQQLKVPLGEYYEAMKQSLESKGSIESITTCWIRLQFFYFADGTRWSPSGYQKPDPNSLGKWLPMTRDEFMGTTPVESH